MVLPLLRLLASSPLFQEMSNEINASHNETRKFVWLCRYDLDAADLHYRFFDVSAITSSLALGLLMSDATAMIELE